MTRPLGKDHREVQEQGRQQSERDGVTPVERPVETIERPVEREGEDAEKCDAQPEKMERRLIARTPQTNGGSDQQREEADRRQHEIHRVSAGRRRERELERLAGSRSQDGVNQASAGAATVLVLDHVGRCLDGRAVHRQQHIAALDARGRRCGVGSHFRCGHTFAAARPQHAVLDLMPP
jgi:hypothetical protein